VYRLTALDDQLRVPIVPYAKLGAAYYVWWVRAPSGDIAEAPTEECTTPATCDGDSAAGASIGVVGTLGIAIRAERVDPESALSMQNAGIAHAGFYAELSYAKVDGFGSEKKLSVGDFTWLAGINFEF
jgi:hypothetical protein